MMRGYLLGWRECESFPKPPRTFDSGTNATAFPRMIIVSAFFLNIGHPGIVKELGAVKASGGEEKEEA